MKKALQKRSSRRFEWVFTAHEKASQLQGVGSAEVSNRTEEAESAQIKSGGR